MEHSRRGSMLLRVRMTATVTIRWGVHRLYEIAITRNDVMDVALLLRALKIVGCGECQKCRGFGVWKARKGSGI